MKHIPNISQASIYVGTYRKYNSGSIEGKWLNMADYSDKDEFYDVCRELHSDEDDAEFMFQDWEHIPVGLIGESWLSDNFFELRDAVDDLGDVDAEAFAVWCGHNSCDIADSDPHILISRFRDQYQGQWDDEEDYARHIIDECYELSEFAQTYFDYEKFARDLFMGDYWIEDGYVFLSC